MLCLKQFTHKFGLDYSRLDKINWCTFSRDQVPYLQYVNNEDGLYDKKLRELYGVVEEMNHRK